MAWKIRGPHCTGDWLRVINHRKGGLANTEFVGIYCGYICGYNGTIMGIAIWSLNIGMQPFTSFKLL